MTTNETLTLRVRITESQWGGFESSSICHIYADSESVEDIQKGIDLHPLNPGNWKFLELA